MEQKSSMTAMVSAFARAYHAEHNEEKIFDDRVAKRLFRLEEYQQMSKTMAEGIGFFHPGFSGTPEEALRWVVDHQLSPSPLGRAAFVEEALERAVADGAEQYLIFGAGYDTFAYRQPEWAGGIQIFEIDHPATAVDKKRRLEAGGIDLPENVHYLSVDFTQKHWQRALLENGRFCGNAVSFCSMLGLVYYLTGEELTRMLSVCGGFLPKGSLIAFDYPEREGQSQQSRKQVMLAEEAGEAMRGGYTRREMETLLAAHGFFTERHLSPEEITAQYFSAHNEADPEHAMAAFDQVNYVLAARG